jgi:ADP-heptose:LPS heptosyltransferase
MRVAASAVELVGRLVFIGRKDLPVRPDCARTVAILKFDRIGDTFLATPSLEALRGIFANAHIIFLAAPWNQEVLAGNPHFDELRVITAVPDVHQDSRAAFFRWETVSCVAAAAREIAPDVAIDLQGNPLNMLVSAVERVADLAGKLTLGESCALLARAQGFVGNDSAPGHLAAATGIPTVIIMSSWPGVERWKAVSPHVQVIYRNHHRCAGPGCFIQPCPNMVAITPDEVFHLLGDRCLVK